MAGHARAEAVVAVTVAFTVLAFIATSLRLITRILIVRSAGVDDLVIVVALLLSIALTTCMCQQVHYGMGRHAHTLSDHDLTNSLKWFWASVWIYYLALMCAKLSILLQYLRIFPERRFRRCCGGLMAIIVGWSVWAFFSALFACRPIQHFWSPEVPGSCLNRLAVWFSNAAVNIATDIATAALPLPVLKSLNLPKRQRLILMLVFGMGGAVCIISILRLSSLYAISVSTDVSWDNYLAAIWSSCEVNFGILCSCLPTLKGCIARYFPRLFASVHASSRPTSYLGALELGGPGRKKHAFWHVSTMESKNRDETPAGKKSRMASFWGKSEKVLDDDDDDDGGGGGGGGGGGDNVLCEASDRYLGRLTPIERAHGIRVTTVVEQEEERDSNRNRRESESVVLSN